MITIARPGPLALIQDLGRPGHAALGVPPSGAADRAALRLANRLLGNPERAAAIEATLGGLSLRTDTGIWCAVTGPAVAVSVDGRPVGSHRRLRLEPGQTLALGTPARGLRNYLAVRGGLAVEPVLGSASTDRLSGLGPDPLDPGRRLRVGPEPETALPPAVVLPAPPTVGELWLTPGPRYDRLTVSGRRTLFGARWQVSAESDRVGVRLSGPVVERGRADELPSEGLLRGAVQLPPSGQPVLFGADHPVTGGYPVVAVLTSTSADASGQLRPGDRVRLRLRPGPPDLEPGAPRAGRVDES